MALTLETPFRNDLADQADDSINVSGPGELQFETAGDVEVATIVFQNPAFGAAAVGVITLQGVPLSDLSAAGGTTVQFSIFDGAAEKQFEGTVATAGADINISSTIIAATEQVDLISLTITVPAS